MNIKDKIRELRTEKGLSTYKLAEIMTNNGFKINQSTISKIETGRQKIDTDTLIAIANALNVPIDSFFENVFQKWDIIYDSEKLAKEVKAMESFESLLKQYGYNFRMFSYGEEDITNEDPIYEIYLTPKESIELTKGQYEELMKELREFVDFKLHRLKGKQVNTIR